MSKRTDENLAVIEGFPVTQKWPAEHPERLQVYSFGTPNGVKATIALEELELAYELHNIGLSDEVLRSAEFLALNPNNKIPAIIDPIGPDGTPLGLFESGAILAYLGNKAGRLIGQTDAERFEVLQWLFWQVGGLGPMVGQFGYFHAFAGKDIEDPRPGQRYLEETVRLLGVLERALEGRTWIAGEYSVADIAIGPWLQAIVGFYQARLVTGFDSLPLTSAYLERFADRSAVQKGWAVFQS